MKQGNLFTEGKSKPDRRFLPLKSSNKKHGEENGDKLYSTLFGRYMLFYEGTPSAAPLGHGVLQ